jgi:hypothetical protein
VKKKPQHSPHSKEQLLRERKRKKSRNPSPDLKKTKPPSLYSLKGEHIPLPRKCPAKVR